MFAHCDVIGIPTNITCWMENPVWFDIAAVAIFGIRSSWCKCLICSFKLICCSGVWFTRVSSLLSVANLDARITVNKDVIVNAIPALSFGTLIGSWLVDIHAIVGAFPFCEPLTLVCPFACIPSIWSWTELEFWQCSSLCFAFAATFFLIIWRSLKTCYVMYIWSLHYKFICTWTAMVVKCAWLIHSDE